MTCPVASRRYRIVNQTPSNIAPAGEKFPFPSRSFRHRDARPRAAKAEGPAGLDILDYMRFLGALVLIIGMIAGAAWLARRYGLAPKVTGGNGRIGIVAVQSLDTRRKLVLVRRDDREHLLVVGPTGESVIETGITPPAGTGVQS